MPDVERYEVDDLYPYDPRITLEERLDKPMPERLRGYEDRKLAQMAWEMFCLENPLWSKQQQPQEVNNPRHWTEGKEDD